MFLNHITEKSTDGSDVGTDDGRGRRLHKRISIG